MDDFTPFLQIIHISDLHVKHPRSSNAASIRASVRKLRKILPKEILESIEDGVAEHDQLAVNLFVQFVERITKDPEWLNCKTWLIDTGDLTSLGDQISLNLGQEYLARFKKICPDLFSIYGNHDAWPGTIPLLVSNAKLAAQSKTLASLKYSVGKPGLALQTDIPHGGGKVQLFSLDSVKHDRWYNLRALGKVPDPQLKALKALVDLNYDSKRHDFRILAVHHPVHFPPPRKSLWMSMSNDSDVANFLNSRGSTGASPLAHLVLSGHTHSLFPSHGKLPLQPSLCPHLDLGSDQCQFVVGSLMQYDKYQKRVGWPHQCELLRLYYSPSDQTVLLIERLLAARQAGERNRGTGIGPYEFVRVNRYSNKTEEPITFSLV